MGLQQPNDVIAEKAVLAGLLRHSSAVYSDVADILNTQCFTDEQNATIFDIFTHILKTGPNTKLDVPTTLSTAKELGLYAGYFDTTHKVQYLRALENFNIQISNVRPQAQKLRKLLITRDLRYRLKEADRALEGVGGTESFTQILAKAETPIFDIINEVTKRETSQITRLPDVVQEYIQNIIDNPEKSVGIPTGFDLYDSVIGGGFRRGKVNLVGGRLKSGKSFIGAQIAINISKRGIPVLILDLELNKEDQLPRAIASISEGLSISAIENGEFIDDRQLKHKLDKGLEKFQDCELYHVEIGGMEFEEVLSTCRRWITRYVGFEKNGDTKPCLIVYDYIDVLDASELGNLQETQVLGLYMRGLENFGSQYKVPFLVLAQLNRDGISAEHTGVFAGSDRLARYAANVAIVKFKSEEEIKDDGIDMGNRKLVVIATRFGGGHSFGEYVHIGSNLKYGKLVELGSKVSSGDGKYINQVKKKPEFEVDTAVIEF